MWLYRIRSALCRGRARAKRELAFHRVLKSNQPWRGSDRGAWLREVAAKTDSTPVRVVRRRIARKDGVAPTRAPSSHPLLLRLALKSRRLRKDCQDNPEALCQPAIS